MPVWNYDPTQYKENDYQIIPVGDYRARIIDVEEKKYSSGNEGYEITLEINGYNSKLWVNLVLDASNPTRTNQRIGEFFNSFGITSPAMGSGKQWIGMVGAVRVRHEEYNGQTRARVAYFIGRSRQDKLDAWKNVSGAAAPAATPEIDIPSDLPFEV